MEQPVGIEPTSPEWRSGIINHYTMAALIWQRILEFNQANRIWSSVRSRIILYILEPTGGIPPHRDVLSVLLPTIFGAG